MGFDGIEFFEFCIIYVHFESFVQIVNCTFYTFLRFVHF